MSLHKRLERLEAEMKPPVPPPRSEKRERAFARLFQTLDELKRLVEREGPLSEGDAKARAIIERHQRKTNEEAKKGV